MGYLLKRVGCDHGAAIAVGPEDRRGHLAYVDVDVAGGVIYAAALDPRLRANDVIEGAQRQRQWHEIRREPSRVVTAPHRADSRVRGRTFCRHIFMCYT